MVFDNKLFQWCLSQTALPMAQPSQVEGRLRGILRQDRGRNALARNTIVVIALIALCVLLPLAALRFAPTATRVVSPPSAPVNRAVISHLVKMRSETLPANPSWTRKLDNGLSVELVGVTSGIGKSAASWTPDGLQMTEPLYRRRDADMTPQYADTQQVREFALRLKYPPTTSVELTTVIPGSVGISWGSGPAFNNNALVTDEREFSKETGGFRVISAVFPKTLTQATVRVGLAGGPWRTDASGRTDGPSGYHITNRDGSLDEILFGKTFPSAGRYVLTVSDTYVKQDFRIVAVCVNGQVTDLHDTQEQNGQKFRVTTVTFDLPLNQIKEFRFQTRPYQWVEFRNIPLQPRGSQGSQT